MFRLVSASALFFALIATGLFVSISAQSSRVQASENGANCQIVKVAVDEGYGISQTQARTICR